MSAEDSGKPPVADAAGPSDQRPGRDVDSAKEQQPQATLKDFYADMKEVDRENEVMRILGAFRLNPYEILGLRFDVDPKEIPRTYRKASLAVHPDKCTHAKASDAFEMLGQAHRDLIDEEKKHRVDLVLGMAKDHVMKEWKKSAKNDAASQLAAALHGMEHVMGTWMNTDEFHEAWKAKGRDVLAKTEWRKRKLTQRLEEETGRAKDEVRKQKEEAAEMKVKQKTWEDAREKRIDSWRSFANGDKKKKKKAKKDGDGIKPPVKLFRPPKPKAPA